MPYKPIDRTRLESLARNHTASAIKVLAGVMTNTMSKDCDRIRAAEILLNRAWGKPTERIEGQETNGQRLVSITHRIVHLKPRSREEIAESEPLLVEWKDISANGEWA
jgi:hypothetical protein